MNDALTEVWGIGKGSIGTVLVLIVLRLLIKILDIVKLPGLANQIRHLIGDNEKDNQSNQRDILSPRAE